VKGDEKNAISVKLQPCASVVGRVVDHTGKPVEGAEAVFQSTEYHVMTLVDQKLLRDSRAARTDANGTFTFDRMFPGDEVDLIVSLPRVQLRRRPIEADHSEGGRDQRRRRIQAPRSKEG
jgi:hypothetical protein